MRIESIKDIPMKHKLELQIDLGIAYSELGRAKDIIKELWPLREELRDIEEKHEAQMAGKYSVMMMLSDECDKVEKENKELKVQLSTCQRHRIEDASESLSNFNWKMTALKKENEELGQVVSSYEEAIHMYTAYDLTERINKYVETNAKYRKKHK